MEVRILPLGSIQTNAFLLLGRSSAVLIDAPENNVAAVEGILRERELSLEALLLTHGHWDHMAGAAEWVERGVPTYGHPADRDLFENPQCMADFMPPGLIIPPVHIDHWLEGGESLRFLDGETFEVRPVPGHAPGNILFYLPGSAACFSGDALFAGGIGRYDLPGGDFRVLEDSIRTQMYTLPDETEVYPGHGPVTTIGAEKRGNPFVRA